MLGVGGLGRGGEDLDMFLRLVLAGDRNQRAANRLVRSKGLLCEGAQNDYLVWHWKKYLPYTLLVDQSVRQFGSTVVTNSKSACGRGTEAEEY